MALHQRSRYSHNISGSPEPLSLGESFGMPIISEDELAARVDDHTDGKHNFTKHTLVSGTLRHSLLTKALHTDSESQDEHVQHSSYRKLPSVSSTCSTQSIRSAGDFTSDDGHVSPSTRASTPGSPRTMMGLPKLNVMTQLLPPASIDSHHDSDTSQVSPLSATPNHEAAIEAKLGRKRCIMFSCGRKDSSVRDEKPAADATSPVSTETKRKSTIKFACPFKPVKPTDTGRLTAPPRTAARHLSPAPPVKTSATPSTPSSRHHRDSDATIRNDSPNTPRATPANQRLARKLSISSDIPDTEAYRFHEFASEEEEHEDWTQESTCHRSRLTVNDTLKKEMDIRKLIEEADEEEAFDDELKKLDDDEDGLSDFDDEDYTDDGFQTDNEEGFAESDDDEDDDSDYEWWAPSRSRATSPYFGHNVLRSAASRTYSNSSSSDGEDLSPSSRQRSRLVKRSKPLEIRPRTPELPDSTDFVCGTLDEDRPLEAAYLSVIAQKKAAKHRARPQDIDPSFPVSDPEMVSDDDDEDEDEEDEQPLKVQSDTGRDSEVFVHGMSDDDDDDEDEEEHRGRRLRSPAPMVLSPSRLSPKRLRSPPPPPQQLKKVNTGHRSPIPKKGILIKSSPPMRKKPCNEHRSPAPAALFNHRSPRRYHSPPPAGYITSPPPSRHASIVASEATTSSALEIPLLGTRNSDLTHTASLPRSPFLMRRPSHHSSSALSIDSESDLDAEREAEQAVVEDEDEDEEDDDDDDDEGSSTDKATPPSSHQKSFKPRYARGAIDITQGLEAKRLKRRELFYKQYLRKEGKKERSGKLKRPLPGKGAERMRQVGLDCAVYRGTRMLSV